MPVPLLVAALATMQVTAPTTWLIALSTNKNTAFWNLHFIHHAPLGLAEKKTVKLMQIQADFIIIPQHTKSLAKATQTISLMISNDFKSALIFSVSSLAQFELRYQRII